MNEWEKWEEELTESTFWFLHIVFVLAILLVILSVWMALEEAYLL